MNIISQKFNPLLKRDEIIASIEADRTPSRKDVVSSLAHELKTKEELIIVNKISGSAGEKIFKVNAYVYKKVEDIPKYELEKMKGRIKEGGDKATPQSEQKKEE